MSIGSTHKNPVLVVMVILMSTIIGCATVAVDRIDTEETVDLTDRWNDTDSSLVAKEMIGDMLEFPWIRHYQKRTGRMKPTVIIQHISNRSHEHIAVDTFINDLKRAMIRSDKVDFVVSEEERRNVRVERQDQELHSKEGTQAAMGEEQGADFALSGSIDSIVDQLGGKRVTFYQTDLKLIDMTSNREVWNGQKKIKKVQKRSRFGL
ncbi:MAG: penicillin-binding protein activator LpoB [Gammaproteobacteria bacterium]|nr:penicillin-binding protein activator LpoB [Gammaproteobacteria bacterium]